MIRGQWLLAVEMSWILTHLVNTLGIAIPHTPRILTDLPTNTGTIIIRVLSQSSKDYLVASPLGSGKIVGILRTLFATIC